MTVCCIYENEAFSSEIEYTFRLIFSLHGVRPRLRSYAGFSAGGCSASAVVISYGKEKPEGSFAHHIHISESSLFGDAYLSRASLPKAPLPAYRGIPLIFAQGTTKEDWAEKQTATDTGTLIDTKIDIIASCFFLASRYEEVVLQERDAFDRFPATASLAHREGFLHRPLVHEYAELLWTWIEQLDVDVPRKPAWPNGRFAACITHDVDTIRKYGWRPPLRSMARLAFKQRKARRALQIGMDYVRARIVGDPYDTFEYLMKLSARYGLRSTYFIMAGGRSEHDGLYSLRDRRVVKLLSSIRDTGSEVSLHSSFDATCDAVMLAHERDALAQAIGEPVRGVRQHFLRWQTPGSWLARETASFRYDATLCFADHEGFRCGLCVPFRPYDVLARREIAIWELPLTVMDGSLFDYQELSPDEGYRRIRALIEAVEAVGGVFVLLWHNSSLDEAGRPGWRAVYEKTLDYVAARNVYADTVGGVIETWEQL